MESKDDEHSARQGPPATDVAIGYTTLGAAKLALLGLGMTVLSGLIAFRAFNDVKAGSFAEFVGWVGLVIFGGGTIYGLWQMATTKGPVVTLTETGIRDIRLANDEIPWLAIRALSQWQAHRQKILVLDVEPEAEARLTLSRMARLTRGANARLGIAGLCVSTQGLAINPDDLARLCAERVARARAHASGAAPV